MHPPPLVTDKQVAARRFNLQRRDLPPEGAEGYQQRRIAGVPHLHAAVAGAGDEPLAGRRPQQIRNGGEIAGERWFS